VVGTWVVDRTTAASVGPAMTRPWAPRIRDMVRATPWRGNGVDADLRVRWTRFGVAAAVCLFVSVATLAAFSLPWRGTLDSPDHLDYVYQVHLGQIPDAYGSEYGFPGERNVRSSKARQFASAHPPGYYAIVAPVMGPLLDRDRWVAAIAFGRAVNIAFGAVGAVAMGWFMWRLGGRRRGSIAVAAAATGSLTVAYVTFSGDIYNDIAVTACSIAMVGTACVVARDGLTVRRSLALVALAALGMTFKSTHLFAILVSYPALLFAVCWHRGESLRRRLGVAAATAVGMVAAPALAIGWFYARNRARSGSWFRSTPKAPLQGRAERSLTDNLTNPDFYLTVPARLLGSERWDLGAFSGRDLSAAIFFVAAALCLAGLARLAWTRSRTAIPTLVVAALLALHLALLYGAQLQHATGFGAYNFRYFLPASLTIAAVLAVGAVQTGRFAPAAVLALLSTQTMALLVSIHAYLHRRYPDLLGGRGIVDGIRHSIGENRFPLPSLVLTALLTVAAAGVAVVTYSMWRLTHYESLDVSGLDDGAFGEFALDDGELGDGEVATTSP
jgi:hypothetical protein